MYHFQKTAVYMLNTMKGYDLKVEDWAYWNWPKDRVKNNDWQWLWTGGVKDGLFRYGHLYKGTIEGVRELAKLGDVIIITSRPSNAVGDTLDWLAYLNLPFREIHILSGGEEKSSVRACDLYVDDKPENILDYKVNTPGLSLLWTRPWNVQVQDEDYTRVSSWAEVIEYADRLKGIEHVIAA
jgi:uncharacterized HAD superfamily protein